MEYIKEFIKHKESIGEKAIYRVNDTRGYTYYSDDYVMWLEQQLRIHDVSGSLQINWDDVYKEANHRSPTAFDEYVKSICNDR
jgi:hypothetical protein